MVGWWELFCGARACSSRRYRRLSREPSPTNRERWFQTRQSSPPTRKPERSGRPWPMALAAIKSPCYPLDSTRLTPLRKRVPEDGSQRRSVGCQSDRDRGSHAASGRIQPTSGRKRGRAHRGPLNHRCIRSHHPASGSGSSAQRAKFRLLLTLNPGIVNFTWEKVRRYRRVELHQRQQLCRLRQPAAAESLSSKWR